MNDAVRNFVRVMATQSEIDVTGRSVLEVGSGDINGGIRSIISEFGPKSYTGVDMTPGPGVDVVCDAGSLLDEFEPEMFDLVISTEMLEHVEKYQQVVRSMGAVLKVGGQMVITTRSQPFPYHAFPDDHWRYNMRAIAALFEGISVRPEFVGPDWEMPGVLGKGTKVGRNVRLPDDVPVPGVTDVYRGSQAIRLSTSGAVRENQGKAVVDFFASEVRGERPVVASVGMEVEEMRHLGRQIRDLWGE